MTTRMIPLVLALGCTFGLAQSSSAQVFTDRALFVAASGPLSGESFECFEAGSVSSADPLATPAFGMTIVPVLSSTLAPMNIQKAPNPSGPHATDGTHFVQCGATPSSNGQFDLTISFAAPVEEFGLTVTDFGEYVQLPGSLTATVLGVTHTIASNPPVQVDGSERFWGLRSPGAPFTTVVIRKSTQGDGIGLDDLLHSDLGLPDHCGAAWTDLGFAKAGTLGAPQLAGWGSLGPGSVGAIELSAAMPLSSAILVSGLSTLYAPIKGGTLVPYPDLLVTLPTGVSGALDVPFVFPVGVPSGVALSFQYWILDPVPSFGLSASNGLQGVTP